MDAAAAAPFKTSGYFGYTLQDSNQEQGSPLILSTLHIHLDHDNCLEVVVIAGKLADLQELANTLISTKGVKHGPANWTTSGANL